MLLELVGGAARTADGSVGSTRATGTAGDTGLDCSTDESAGVAAAASLSVPRASREEKGEDMAPMGSEGSTGAELDSEKSRVDP